MTEPLRPQALRPGDIMVGSIGGLVPGLLPVALGQVLLAGAGQRRTAKQWWRWRHIAVVAGLAAEDGWPQIVQAMPSGAELVALPPDGWAADHLYIRPAYAAGQALRVAHAALGYVGRRYSFADYAALAWHRCRDGGQPYRPIGDRDWLDRYVADSRRMICSQLADQALSDAGWHVFDDDRLAQDVMPAELACALLGVPGEHLRPGQGAWTANTMIIS